MARSEEERQCNPFKLVPVRVSSLRGSVEAYMIQESKVATLEEEEAAKTQLIWCVRTLQPNKRLASFHLRLFFKAFGMEESKSKTLSVAVTLKGGTNYLLWSRLVKAAVGSKGLWSHISGKALTTQHTPGKSTDGEMIRRSDIDALIKALKENGNCMNSPLGYSLAASYIDRTDGYLSHRGNQSDGAHENEGSASPDQQGMRNEDETEERDQFEQTETTTDEVEIQEAAPLDPEGGNQGEPPVSEEVHDQEEHHDQGEEVEDQNQNLEALPKGPMTRSRSRKLTQVPMGKESEEEAELVRKNKMLRDQMTEQMNQTMISTMADMLKASMKELREEMRQELRQATGQGHSNESRRNRPTPIRQEHAGSQETDNYYSRNRTEHNPTER
ncbi:hypothetical protein IGI04_042375, partial [Brassica rapa subsp. trilocularis]